MTTVLVQETGKCTRLAYSIRGVLRYENLESGCSKIQPDQPDPAHPDRPGSRFGAGTVSAGRGLGRRAGQPVRRCTEGHCPGAGVCHCGKRTGTGLVQAGPPLWHRDLAVHAHHLSGGSHCGHHQLYVPGHSRAGRCGAVRRDPAGSGRGAEHPADQLCGQPRQRPDERQLHRHPVLGLYVRHCHEEHRRREHQGLSGKHRRCRFSDRALDHQSGTLRHHGSGVHQRFRQRSGHLYPVWQAAGAAGGHHAVHGADRFSPHHVHLPALQPVPAGIPLPEGVRPDRFLHPQLCRQHPREYVPV